MWIVDLALRRPYTFIVLAISIVISGGLACLIVDMRMPGMSGLELQRQMAFANSHIPIIFITAYAEDNRRTQALEAGAVAFLYKPFQEGELLNAIDAALKDS